MSWRSTLILSFLVVAAAGYLWLGGTPPPQIDGPTTQLGDQPAREPAGPIEHVLDFDPATVVAVHLEHNGEVRQTERDGEGWRGLGDAAAINDFLHNLAAVGVLAEIPATDADLNDYGLHPPRSTVRLQLRGAAAPIVLQIGDRNPATTGVYVRKGEGARVVLAGALVTWEFDKAFKTLGESPASS